jgi:hypothetical protein
MDWKAVLAIVIPFLLAALGQLVPMLLEWLKNQKWVQAAHLEDLFATLLPQAFEWVEYWAKKIYEPTFGKAPSGEMKLAKNIELIRKHLPKQANKMLTDEDIRLRIEHTLKDKGEGIAKEAKEE